MEAIETEIVGAGDPAPGRAITILLEIFEGVLTVFDQVGKILSGERADH